jgi:hypothetical protein
MSIALGNIVLADHGCTIDMPPIQVPDNLPVRMFRPSIPYKPLTCAAPLDDPKLLTPASKMTWQDPRKARPQIRLHAEAGSDAGDYARGTAVGCSRPAGCPD